MSAVSTWAKSVAVRLDSRDHGRRRFLSELPEGAEVFDVGCGNDSPYLFKSIRPDIRYVGLDIGDYYQDHEPTAYADDYVVVPVADFLTAIEQRSHQFDAVVSAHNLEHCDDPDNVVRAMAQALRPGGRLYLAFPAAASLSMPSRVGTLNFFDDSTHIRPPDFEKVLGLLRAEGVTIDFAAERYRPPSRVVIGAVNEPVSRLRKKVMRGTWALYGFETIIWGTRAST